MSALSVSRLMKEAFTTSIFCKTAEGLKNLRHRRVGRRMWAILILSIALAMNSIRIYQAQEIFSAGLIFVAGLVCLVALGGVCYIFGAIIECVWEFTEG